MAHFHWHLREAISQNSLHHHIIDFGITHSGGCLKNEMHAKQVDQISRLTTNRPKRLADFSKALPIATPPETHPSIMKSFLNFAKVVWASPNTFVGLVIGLTGLLFGGHVRRAGRALEFYEGGIKWFLHQLPNGHFILAMTLGHVVLGQTDASLEISREHEAVHVEQYERWGPFMLPAYFLASVYVWLRGGRFYRDNPFEREARARDHHGENN